MSEKIESFYQEVANDPGKYLSQNSELTKNKVFMLKVCKLNGRALKYASEELKNNQKNSISSSSK